MAVFLRLFGARLPQPEPGPLGLRSRPLVERAARHAAARGVLDHLHRLVGTTAAVLGVHPNDAGPFALHLRAERYCGPLGARNGVVLVRARDEFTLFWMGGALASVLRAPLYLCADADPEVEVLVEGDDLPEWVTPVTRARLLASLSTPAAVA